MLVLRHGYALFFCDSQKQKVLCVKRKLRGIVITLSRLCNFCGDQSTFLSISAAGEHTSRILKNVLLGELRPQGQ
jgi:hypothetical protein